MYYVQLTLVTMSLVGRALRNVVIIVIKKSCVPIKIDFPQRELPIKFHGLPLNFTQKSTIL